MATTQEKWQEIANRGLQDNFDTATRAKFDEAVNRGLITMPQAQQPSEPETSIGQDILGGIESAGVIASNIIAEPLAGLAGLGTLATTFDPQQASQAVEGARQRLAIQPETAAAESQLQAIGEGGESLIKAARFPAAALAGAGTLAATFDPQRALQVSKDVVEKGVSEELGAAVFDVTGSPEVAAIAHTLPTAVLEALGVGAILKGPKAAATAGRGLEAAGQAVEGAIENIPQRKTPLLPREKRTQDLISRIEQKDASIKTLGKGVEPRAKPTTLTGKFVEKLRVQGPELADRPLETGAVKQGFDKGIVADIKDSTPSTKAKMQKMLDLKERGLDQARFGAMNPPSDIVGDSLMERINVIMSANKSAGKKIGEVAKKTLRGQDIDVQAPIFSFADELQDFGIGIGRNKEGGFSADYTNSILPRGDRGAINEVIRVMNIKGRGGIDAETVHDMKKILDNHISYGKTKDGLSADAEGILRSLRGGLDEALDSKFPEYDAANVAYAETINAINQFQDVAGKKLDLSSPTAKKAAGREMRKILSNFGSRQRLVDAVDEIEGVADKYKGFGTAPDGTLLIEEAGRKTSKFDDNLLSLVLFDNELDGRFIPSARGGFENLVSRKVTRAAQAAASPTGIIDVGIQVAGKAAEKVKGVTDESAFSAMRDLLKSTN